MEINGLYSLQVSGPQSSIRLYLPRLTTIPLNLPTLQWMIHPVATFVLELCLIAFIIGHTRSHSILRLAALPAVFLLTTITILSGQNHIRKPWAGLLGGIGAAFFLQYIELGLLSRWSYETRGPEISCGQDTSYTAEKSIIDSQDTFWDRFRFGLATTVQFRNIDLPSEVKNVPRFSSQHPTHVPLRLMFIFRSVRDALLCYLVLDSIQSASPAPEENSHLISRDHVPLFGRITDISSEEIIVRLSTTLVFWINLYCLLRGLLSLLSIVAVASGMSAVRSWRPLFGSPLAAYSVRRFWKYGLPDPSNLTCKVSKADAL